MPKSRRSRIERYELDQSPLAQKPTQKELASLIGETKADLVRLVNYKEQFIRRREEAIGKKQKLRKLAYPVGRLRAAHERLKYQLNKVKKPAYLMSPRSKISTRDNAVMHLGQHQYLTLDIKQFYPSTTSAMIRRFFVTVLGMYEDVARILTKLCTVDGLASFGSPLTPVLCSLVHRAMFDEIDAICRRRGLKFSVWVDDMTISGNFVPREVLAEIRLAIRRHGFQSHKIEFRSGHRPVVVTGVGVRGQKLIASTTLEKKIQSEWEAFKSSVPACERDAASAKLLSSLGTKRHIVGRNTLEGRKVSSEMNSVRQKRAGLASLYVSKAQNPIAPFDVSEAVPF